MLKKRTPGIYLATTDAGQEVDVLLVDLDGSEYPQPRRVPGEDLISFIERDYSQYRRELLWLWDEHPLFDERIDIPEQDYADFCAQALALPEEYLRDDPIAYFAVVRQINAALQMPDDGSAMFLLLAGQQLLRDLELPLLAQAQISDVFEEGFDSFERGTQRQRFEQIEKVWPGAIDHFFTCRILPNDAGNIPVGNRLEYGTLDITEFYLIELAQYFRQEKYRIARCEHCLNYFIPKTRQETHYCKRIYDGVACNKAGPDLKRLIGAEKDEVMKTFKRLKKRMRARLDRFENASEWKRGDLFQMNASQYTDWLDMAHKAYKEYAAKKISSEEFLRRIDVYEDLVSESTEDGITEPG